MKNGDAVGSVTVNEKTGEVTVGMHAESKENVEYKRFNLKGIVKVKPRVRIIQESRVKLID